MKTVKYLLITITFLFSNISYIHAQDTEGTEFWLTFGSVHGGEMYPPFYDMNIRIVGGNVPTSGTIYFTNLERTISFDIDPYQIYNYSLDTDEKYAAYNFTMGITNHSIHINTLNSVSVYASIQMDQYFEVTNILPVTALGTEYYAISFHVFNPNMDAYSVVATQNDTQLYHEGIPISNRVLNAGDVYYRTSYDMTGEHITSNKPCAFFTQNKLTAIPYSGLSDILFQQLAPVNTWGKNFFVPVSLSGIEYVRIVVSQDNTTISQSGGTIRTDTGGESTLINLQAGQFVQLEIYLDSAGCYIQANKPVGVCSFMRSRMISNPEGSTAQVWIPSIEQSVSNVLTAPFIAPPIGNHYALVCTSTITRENTRVSIGGASPDTLSGGSWYANDTAHISFYNFPLTNFSSSYIFSNPEGRIWYQGNRCSTRLLLLPCRLCHAYYRCGVLCQRYSL